MGQVRVLRERHETPEPIQDIITRVGGMTPPGYRRQPRFRVTWGWNRIGWTGGEWGAIYCAPTHNPNRWYLEKWLPPEMCGPPKAWNWQELGPYPSDGEYEHVLTLEDPITHGFVGLSVAATEQMIRVVEFCRGYRMAERKAALRAREEGKERRFEQDASDILDDARKAMYGCPFVTVPKGI